MSPSDIRAATMCAVEARLHRSSKEDIIVLIDTNESYTQPTGGNIHWDLKDLVRLVVLGEWEWGCKGGWEWVCEGGDDHAGGWEERKTERDCMRCEAVCCVRQWGTRVRTEEVWAEMREWGWGGWSHELKNEGVRISVYSYIYIYMGFFSNFMVIRSYPGRVSSFFDKTQTRFGFFFKTHTRPYSLSGQVKSSPLGSGRVRYLQVGSKFPSLKRCA